jgi:hypothetical protein
MADTCPSGANPEITGGGQRAILVAVDNWIRGDEVGDRPAFDPDRIECVCDGGHCAPLMPWHYRLAGGNDHSDGEGS